MSIFGAQTQTKKSYKINNIVVRQPLNNISNNKQNTNKLTKLSTNQQYKIPQQLGKILSRIQQSTDQLDTTFQDEENQTPSFMQSPTFSKQSDISEVKSEQYIITKLQEQTNIAASQSTLPSYEQTSSPHPQEQTLTLYEQAHNDFNQQPAHEIFKILEDLQQSSI